MVKIPATAEGVAPIRQMIAEGRNINVTLIFSLERYQRGDGRLHRRARGLRRRRPAPTSSKVASVASFFISRVDTEVDRRLEAIGTPEALGAARQGGRRPGQARLPAVPARRSPGHRWEALAAAGARVQRPLWASTSTKNPAYPDTLYVDELIGPDTVNTLPDATIEAFADHGTLARRVDADVDEAEAVWAALAEVGVDMADVADAARARGRVQLPEELRRAARRARGQGRRARRRLNRPTMDPQRPEDVQVDALGTRLLDAIGARAATRASPPNWSSAPSA